jgi:hypothetical protein
VVASYRTIKSLQQGSATQEERDVPQSLSVAIMGADDERANAAEAKLRRAASNFLGRSLEHAARVAKIGACTTTNLFRGESSRSMAELLSMVVAGPGGAASAELSADRDADGGAPEHAGETEAKPVAARPAPSAPGPQVATKPGAAVSRAARGRESARVLAESIPGLSALPFRCPYAPGVELALGPGGGLHLVASISGDGEAIGPASLLTAASWAQSHAALLEAARPAEVNMSHPDGPVLHVITTDARLARPMLDTGVRVHLVLRVGDALAVHDLN